MSLEYKQLEKVLLLVKAFFVNTSIHCISALFFLDKYLNRTLVMLEVLRPDALGKLIHYYVFL